MEGLRIDRRGGAAPGGGPGSAAVSPVRGGNTRVVLLYVVATLLAFPILETVFWGVDARHYGVDVFDDGTIVRLGGWSALFSKYGATLWNPLLTAGNPVFAQFQSTPLALDSLVALVLPPFTTYILFLGLMSLAAGLSMHVFLQGSVGLSRETSALGALFFLLSFRHYNLGFSAVLIPMILWISDRTTAATSARLRWVALGAATATFSLYNAMSQAAVISAGIHLFYALAVPATAADRRSRLSVWLAVWGLGLALFGPVLLTQMALLPDSVRAIRDIRRLELPDFWAGVRVFGQTYAEAILGRPTLGSLNIRMESPVVTLYAGTVGLLILVLPAGQARRDRRERAITWLLVLIPLIDLLALTVGPEAEKHLGVLRSFNFTRVRLFLPFALAANVAIAVSHIRERVQLPRFRQSLTIVGWACTGLFVVQSALCGRAALYLVRRLAFQSSRVAAHERLLAWGLAAGYFACWAVLVVFWTAVWKRKGPAGWPAAAGKAGLVTPLVVLVIVDRLAFSRIERHLEGGHLTSFRKALGETPAIRFLRSLENPEGYRVLTLSDFSRLKFADRPNRLFFFGLPCADGYENIYPLRYYQLFGLLTAPSLDRVAGLASQFRFWGQRAYALGADVNGAVASLMGIRWMHVHGVSGPPGAWKEVFAEGDEKIFENRGVFPRAFVVGELRRFSDRAQLSAALGAASEAELRGTAFVEDRDIGGVAVDAIPSSATIATITRLDPDDVEVDVESPGRGVLVLSDVWVPGWTASVNGARKRVIPVDVAFRGVEIPAGRSQVVLRYRPTYTYAGFALAAAAAVVLGLLVIGPRRQRGAG